jgi:hypothetical protein
MSTNERIDFSKQAEAMEEFEKQAKETGNKPLQGSLKETPMKKDEKTGTYLPVHQSDKPNRKERRKIKQPTSKRNRKNTKGRRVQIAPVMVTVDQTKYGDVKLSTGYNRKIRHTTAETKVNRNDHINKMKSYEAKNPLPPDIKEFYFIKSIRRELV